MYKSLADISSSSPDSESARNYARMLLAPLVAKATTCAKSRLCAGADPSARDSTSIDRTSVSEFDFRCIFLVVSVTKTTTFMKVCNAGPSVGASVLILELSYLCERMQWRMYTACARYGVFFEELSPMSAFVSRRFCVYRLQRVFSGSMERSSHSSTTRCSLSRFSKSRPLGVHARADT
jgi:hypothetical protein